MDEQGDDNKPPTKYQTPFERTRWPPTPAAAVHHHHQLLQSSSNLVAAAPALPPPSIISATESSTTITGMNSNGTTPVDLDVPSSIAGMSHSSRDKVERMQQMLNKTLGPEFLSQRQGGGANKLTYIEGWKAINLANEIFGFNGWYTSIKELNVDFIDFNENDQRFSVGVSAIVQVRLPDGAFHEDVGYGQIENAKSKGMALDKCKKEAVTDALKRALRNFGNLLGNCIYDKHYTAEMAKMRAPKSKVDFKNIHRPQYDSEIADKVAKVNENDPLPDVKGPSVTAAAPASMRAPALPQRATTIGPKPLQPRQPVAPARAPPLQQTKTVSAAAMLPRGPAPNAVPPQISMVDAAAAPRGTPSDAFSAEDESALDGINLDASTYVVGREALDEGDSGFAEGGFHVETKPVVPTGTELPPRSSEAADDWERKRIRAEEMESKRQLALLKQRQQLNQRSPPRPGVAALQRSKTVGNPTTGTMRVVQAGVLPTISVGATPTTTRQVGDGGGFNSAKGIKRTLDELSSHSSRIS